jgi:hypothetical protein
MMSRLIFSSCIGAPLPLVVMLDVYNFGLFKNMKKRARGRRQRNAVLLSFTRSRTSGQGGVVPEAFRGSFETRTIMGSRETSKRGFDL